MKKFAGYDETPVFDNFKALPAGPYRCVIKQAKEEAWTKGEGSNLVILFDIAEGEYKDYFSKDFEAHTTTKKWRGLFKIAFPTDNASDNLKRFFKGVVTSIEKSNPGYKFEFDEKSLKAMKDKKVGFVFGGEEYEKDGKVKTAIKARFVRSWDNVMDADVPEVKKLQHSPSSTSNGSGWNPSTPAAAEDDEDLPF